MCVWVCIYVCVYIVLAGKYFHYLVYPSHEFSKVSNAMLVISTL